MTSQITTSGRSRSIRSSASAPDAADSTCMPRPSSAVSTTFLTLRLSSTTRTLAIQSLLRNRSHGRARAALVDPGGSAQQELLEIAVDRSHRVRRQRHERLEAEGALSLSVRRDQERREGRLADEPEELGVHDLSALEDDDASPRAQREDQAAGLRAHDDFLHGLRQL